MDIGQIERERRNTVKRKGSLEEIRCKFGKRVHGEELSHVPVLPKKLQFFILSGERSNKINYKNLLNLAHKKTFKKT
jgi:hypothetical protein